MTISVDALPLMAFTFILLFARIGTMLMLMPGYGESMVPARLRLSLALMITLAFYPLLSPLMPQNPDGLMAVIVLLFHEIAIGLILGGIARLVLMVTQVAGSTIAFQMGLSMAQTADPTQTGVQGAIIGNFLTIVALAAIFAANLHHLVLAAVFRSYDIFPVASELMFDDAMELALQTVAGSFAVGVQLAAPFIIFGLVFYLGLGLLARLMPQLQVFFIAMPANISVGLVLLAILLVSLMGWYLAHFEQHFTMLAGG